MTTVEINTSARYNVCIASDILCDTGKLVSEISRPCKIAIISDDKVFPLYGQQVAKSLEESGFLTTSYVFTNGERSKNLHTFADILEFLATERLTRSDMIVALGGGVVGDMAGFCAATYLRGIKFVQIPTTILAACDSSVGGKTAVDLAAGKNLAGAFHQPSMVICDTNTFKTLDKRQVSCGFAEVIKYGIICDGDLFEKLLKKDLAIEDIIARCVDIKRGIVERDEKEVGERKLLNLGHTLGHAVEKDSDYSLTHGEAVAIGLVMIAKIAESLKICEPLTEKISLILSEYGLPTDYKISPEKLYRLSIGDKKADGSGITLVLPKKIGECELKRVSLEDFCEILKNCFSEEK